MNEATLDEHIHASDAGKPQGKEASGGGGLGEGAGPGVLFQPTPRNRWDRESDRRKAPLCLLLLSPLAPLCLCSQMIALLCLPTLWTGRYPYSQGEGFTGAEEEKKKKRSKLH